MSEPDPQVRVVGAQAGAQVDVNVRVTTGGAAAAASASAQPNGRRPAESTQPSLAGFFGKRAAPTESEPECRDGRRPGARAPQEAKKQKNTTTVVHMGQTCAPPVPF